MECACFWSNQKGCEEALFSPATQKSTSPAERSVPLLYHMRALSHRLCCSSFSSCAACLPLARIRAPTEESNANHFSWYRISVDTVVDTIKILAPKKSLSFWTSGENIDLPHIDSLIVLVMARYFATIRIEKGENLRNKPSEISKSCKGLCESLGKILLGSKIQTNKRLSQQPALGALTFLRNFRLQAKQTSAVTSHQ